MRILTFLLVLARVLILTASGSADYTHWCPFSDGKGGFAIGGITIDTGMAVCSSAQEGVVLSNSDIWQQAGETGQSIAEDSVIEG